MLTTEMRQQGHYLFRYRSFLPIVIIFPLLIGLSRCDPSQWFSPVTFIWELACFAVSVAGLAVRIGTVGFVPGGTSGRNTKEQRATMLNTTGVYSVVRNPLYLGNLLMWLGIVLTVADLAILAVFVLAFCLYYERIIAAEEEFLTREFGDQFVSWAKTTPALIPRLAMWQYPSEPFSFRTVLKREYCGFLGLTTAFPILILCGHLILEGRLYLETTWIAVFCCGTICFLFLRYLKKQTRFLHVPGR